MFPPFPRAFWLLLAGSFINRLGSFVVPFLSLFLTSERHYTFAQAGLTASLLGVGSVLAGPIGGTLTDRVGRKFTLVLGMGLSAIFVSSITLARTPVEMGVAVFFCGLGGDIFRPAFFATITDLIEPAQRPRAFGISYWIHNMSFAVCMPLAGFFAAGGSLKLFYADSATSLVCGLLIFWGVHETMPVRAAAASSTKPIWKGNLGMDGLATALTDGPFVLFVLLMMVSSMVFLQSMTSLPLAMRLQGIPTQGYGWLLSINGVLIVALQPFAERAVGFLRPARRLALAFAVVAAGFGAHALCSLPWHYAIAIALWTLGEIMQAGIGPTVVAHLAPVHLRGAYQGINGMAWSAGALLAPLLGPSLLEARGPIVLWVSCAVAVGLSAGGMLLLGRRLERAATEI